MHRSSAYPYLVCQFSDSDTTVLHDQSPHFLDDIVIGDVSDPSIGSIFIGYGDGTDRRFQNVANYKPDAGELP